MSLYLVLQKRKKEKIQHSLRDETFAKSASAAAKGTPVPSQSSGWLLMKLRVLVSLLAANGLSASGQSCGWLLMKLRFSVSLVDGC